MTKRKAKAETNHAISNAKAWLSSIEEMLDAEWKAAAEADGWTGPHKDKFGATYFEQIEDGERVTWACGSWKELCEAQSIDTNTAHCEDARRTIEESVLSVMVRDGWRQPGQATDEGPHEYEILLSTGGPALRIYGRVGDHNQPESAEMQWQDWGTPWTPFNAPEATLLRFAECFWFGE